MIRELYHTLHDRLKPIQISGHGNTFANLSKVGRKFLVKVFGNNNSIQIGKGCLLTNTDVKISGENNHLIIDDEVRFMGPCKIIMCGDSTLHIKWNAGIRGVEFNLGGAKIEIGELCMFSYGITVRNHDSHRVLNPETQQVLNKPKDIVLGKHVWVAQNATILKGCHIADDSVIGFGSIVTSSCEPGSIMAGIPAKVVKIGITWDY